MNHDHSEIILFGVLLLMKYLFLIIIYDSYMIFFPQHSQKKNLFEI